MRVVSYLSSISFGVYLANDFGIIVMKKIGLVPGAGNAFLMVPLLAAADLLISVAIASVIHKIPLLRNNVM